MDRYAGVTVSKLYDNRNMQTFSSFRKELACQITWSVFIVVSAAKSRRRDRTQTFALKEVLDRVLNKDSDTYLKVWCPFRRGGCDTKYVDLHLLLLGFIIKISTPLKDAKGVAVFRRYPNLVEHLFYACNEENLFP